MRLMIDILHPAHVHFFKNFYFEMRGRGHEILVTAREKDCATGLLDRLNIPHETISRSTRGPVRQLGEFASRSFRFARLARSFQPDALTGIMGPTIAAVGRLLRRPAYVFYDTEFATTTNRFVYPLSEKVITPECYNGPVRGSHVTYPGYHELAYLHPRRFTPSRDVVRQAGIDPNQPYSLVRFVGWWATHDRHERGLNERQKHEVIRQLEQHSRVVLTSEAQVPAELQDRVYRGPVEAIHHLTAFASLYYGESATMASEAAVLGTPAVFVATTGRGYTDDQAKYGLVRHFCDTDFAESVDAAVEVLENRDASCEAAKEAQQRMLKEKIDVTDFMVQMFEDAFSPAGRATTSRASYAPQ